MLERKGRIGLQLTLVTAVLVAFTGRAAQTTMIGKVTNFRATPEFYPAPNQTQMKSLLEGSEAQPVSGGKILIKQAKLQTFKPDGQKELIVETPECYYQTDTKVVSSAAKLSAISGDAHFRLEGEGF